MASAILCISLLPASSLNTHMVKYRPYPMPATAAAIAKRTTAVVTSTLVLLVQISPQDRRSSQPDGWIHLKTHPLKAKSAVIVSTPRTIDQAEIKEEDRMAACGRLFARAETICYSD